MSLSVCCLSVRFFVCCLFTRSHISKTTPGRISDQTYCERILPVCRGSVHFRWRCDTFCTSGSAYGINFSHSGLYDTSCIFISSESTTAELLHRFKLNFAEQYKYKSVHIAGLPTGSRICYLRLLCSCRFNWHRYLKCRTHSLSFLLVNYALAVAAANIKIERKTYVTTCPIVGPRSYKNGAFPVSRP